MKKTIGQVAVLALLLTGCGSENVDEYYIRACTDKLESAIHHSDKYTDSSLDDITAKVTVKEDKRLVEELGLRDTFFKYTIEFKNFTLKDKFGTDIISTAVCRTSATKWEGKIHGPNFEGYMFYIVINGIYTPVGGDYLPVEVDANKMDNLL